MEREAVIENSSSEAAIRNHAAVHATEKKLIVLLYDD